MYKLSKDNILTSSITVIIFSISSLAAAGVIYSFSTFLMQDILLLIGLLVLTIGSLTLTETNSSSQFVYPFYNVSTSSHTSIEEVTKKDIEIENEHSHYIKHSLYLMKKSTFEFTIAGILLILISLI